MDSQHPKQPDSHGEDNAQWAHEHAEYKTDPFIGRMGTSDEDQAKRFLANLAQLSGLTNPPSTRAERFFQSLAEVLTQIVHWAPHALVPVVCILALTVIEISLPDKGEVSTSRVVLAMTTRIFIFAALLADLYRQVKTRHDQEDGKNDPTYEPSNDPASQGDA